MPVCLDGPGQAGMPRQIAARLVSLSEKPEEELLTLLNNVQRGGDDIARASTRVLIRRSIGGAGL